MVGTLDTREGKPSGSSLSLSLVTMTHQYDSSRIGAVGALHQGPRVNYMPVGQCRTIVKLEFIAT